MSHFNTIPFRNGLNELLLGFWNYLELMEPERLHEMSQRDISKHLNQFITNYVTEGDAPTNQ